MFLIILKQIRISNFCWRLSDSRRSCSPVAGCAAKAGQRTHRKCARACQQRQSGQRIHGKTGQTALRQELGVGVSRSRLGTGVLGSRRHLLFRFAKYEFFPKFAFRIFFEDFFRFSQNTYYRNFFFFRCRKIKKKNSINFFD